MIEKNRSLPNRWIYCPNHSSIIAGTFVATKTFLNDAYDQSIPKGFTFKPGAINGIESRLKIKIGLVIDLSNSQRYYSPSDINNMGIEYVKIACAGHEETPSAEFVKTFLSTCDNFLNTFGDKKILVHCTHGFNRSGFMIVSYLVETLCYDVMSALKYFAICRPKGIYKKDYLEEIIKIYGDPEEHYNIGPIDRPDWESIHVNNPSYCQNLPIAENVVKAPTSQPKFPVENPLITAITSIELEEVQAKMREYFDWNQDSFPGSQPVSLSRINIVLLKREPYMVSWKADGTRYLMYIQGKGKTYFIDRKYDVFIVPQFVFPTRVNLTENLSECVLDGELVFEKEGNNLIPRFLLFDIIIYEGSKLDFCFSKRLDLMFKFVIQPRWAAISKQILNRANEPFRIRNKMFFDKSKVAWLMEEFMPKLPHDTDGLLFQPDIENYKPGVCDSILKWKPEELNSIDFLFSIKVDQKEGCLKEYIGYLYVLHQDSPFGTIDLDSTLRKFDQKIIECSYDKKKEKWKFLRVRTDKDHPNALATAISVLNTINEPVTKENIYQYLGVKVDMKINQIPY